MFQKVLIANRGEIALRIIRACKELGVATVAVHSEPDKDSLYVKMADEALCIGPASSSESYLLIPRILSAAEITNADAIHPGYGFLSENAEFAEKVSKCGITFIGPSPKNIAEMGDKIASRAMMKEAGIPMLESVEINLANVASAIEKIDAMGLPVIVKATAGGGGKGIKIVRKMDMLESTLRAAGAEAKAAFGNETVFVEKYLESARHIEFQIVADHYGNVVHLGERDCSIQRRYQKVLEEAPSPVISDSVRSEMGRLVASAVAKIGYRNVGTVEFLMDRDQKFYFLEMNTRIQVEHPITEEITGLDLVKLQIELASGKKLPFTQEDIAFRGHAIEMRINAEDPEKFYPSPGLITSYHVPGGPGVRVDSGAYDGFTISPYYDSMIAKLIVRGKSREEAISRAEAALKEFLIEGIKSNIPLHQRILRDPKFRAGETHIRYLDNLLN